MARRQPTNDPKARPLRCKPQLSRVVEGLRVLIREVVPGVEERVYKGETSAGYHDQQAGAFCGLFIVADRVRLEFPHGARLTPPEPVLVDGRYVELGAGDKIPSKAIARIIHATLVAMG